MKYIIVAVALLITSTANADCIHNGVPYPAGTIIGPLVCMPDGTWQPKR